MSTRSTIITLYMEQNLIRDILAHFTRETTDPAFRESIFSAYLKDSVEIQEKIIRTLTEQPKFAEMFSKQSREIRERVKGEEKVKKEEERKGEERREEEEEKGDSPRFFSNKSLLRGNSPLQGAGPLPEEEQKKRAEILKSEISEFEEPVYYKKL